MKPEPYRSFDELPLVLSVPEMAAVLGIHGQSLMIWRAARLSSIRIGTRLIIPKENLMEWIQEQLQKKEAL